MFSLQLITVRNIVVNADYWCK